MRLSYLYNGNPYAGKTTSLYWDSTQFVSHLSHYYSTHWRFLLENRRDTANLRTADERHRSWRFCFHFRGITAVVCQDTLSCAHLRQQYDQDWSSGGSVAALVWKPHTLSWLHDAQSRCAAFVGAHTRCTHVHWCSSALLHHHSRSLAEAGHFLALTHDKMKWRCAQ